MIVLGFAAYGYYGDGLNDHMDSEITLSSVYAQVSDMAPKVSTSFAQVPRL